MTTAERIRVERVPLHGGKEKLSFSCRGCYKTHGMQIINASIFAPELGIDMTMDVCVQLLDDKGGVDFIIKEGVGWRPEFTKSDFTAKLVAYLNFSRQCQACC